MDEITRCYYELRFKLAFLEKKGDEFQDFFSSIMEKRYPADFIRVRPWGASGDRKNDGYLKSQRLLFQCYAPNELKATEAIAKIDEDFKGALPYWKKHFDTWVFVHNSSSGLSPQVVDKLLALSKKHSPLNVVSWGFEELRQQAFKLAEGDLASLLGPAPSRQGLINLGLEDLVPVLDHISRLAPVAEPDLRPVPADKLQRNMLSDSAGILLRAGMSRADLVRKYFRLKPPLQDQLAESFRTRYVELRNEGLTPDTIFAELQKFAGGHEVPSPNRQDAVLATLAFFFEECDIFERPAGPEDAS
jgi:hypothetical protein